MPNVLTKDAEKLVCSLYDGYRQKRKNGESKSAAKAFGSTQDMHDRYDSKNTLEDTFETCCELSRAGFLQCEFADDDIYFARLSDGAIAYFEHRIPNGMKSALEWASAIKDAIPFL